LVVSAHDAKTFSWTRRLRSRELFNKFLELQMRVTRVLDRLIVLLESVRIPFVGRVLYPDCLGHSQCAVHLKEIARRITQKGACRLDRLEVSFPRLLQRIP